MKKLFNFLKRIVKIIYPNIEVVGLENLPDEPVVLVGNHSQMHGPIVGELYFENCVTWCEGEMMHLKEVPAYSYKDFWSYKPKWTKWFYKLMSYLIAPLAVFIFNKARTIPVYKDTRIVITFRKTIDKLKEGKSIIIFPEHDVEYNNILFDFQGNFIDVARVFYKRTGKEISFIPMYIAPKLKKVYLGAPIKYNSKSSISEERARIRQCLMAEITEMARNLPEHTVVPYRNMSKSMYPSNKGGNVK